LWPISDFTARIKSLRALCRSSPRGRARLSPIPDERCSRPPMKLVAYALMPDPLPLRPAPATRTWMDHIPDRHAYRCLPLNIANAHGWEVGAVCDMEVAWDGGPHARNLQVRALDGYPHLPNFVVSHFAFGILTFHLTYLFRTEPGWNLFCTGPTNRPKDAIGPLSGVIETDWLPYPFTMNWQMTRPGKVRFDRDEPICLVYPVPANALIDTAPEVRNLGDDPALEAQMLAWKDRRDEFMQRFNARDAATLKEAWQRFYFLGARPDGSPAPPTHVNKLRLAVPVDRRGEKVGPAT
jgi:hypothetical protein